MNRDFELPLPATALLAASTPVSGTLALAASLILLAFGWTLGWFSSTAAEIGQIWWRSETYAHGLIVLPVFAWIAWRNRDRIAVAQARPAPWMVVPAALAGLGWLLGQLVSVSAASHFFLVALVVITLVGTLGWQLSRVLLFPILFLFFGVPIGDFMLPTLMDYTAEFTVWALRASGVPVYKEGLYFVVPNGRWAVVEACSGIRYLIASLTVGALYAYLNYTSLKRRLLFMLVALAVPIVANWLRAYMIVMLGYLTDNKLAAGVDHLIYGWLFFGVIIFLMFWIGSRWHEEPAGSPAAVPTARAPGRTVWLALVPLFAVAPLFAGLETKLETPAAPFELEVRLPAPAAGWMQADEGVAYRPFYNGQRGEATASYRSPDGGLVTVFAAVFASQQPGHEMVTWGNGLVTPEERGPKLVRGGRSDIDGLRFRNATVVAGSERVRVWQWYRINDRQLIGDAELKLRLAADRMLGLKDASAVALVMSAEKEDPATADARIGAFMKAHGAALDKALDAAAEGAP